MALSDRERDVLAQMESNFAKEDPNFTQTMNSGSKTTSRTSPSASSWDPRTIVISVLLVVTGVIIFFAGVNFHNIVIGLAGFVTIVFSIYWAVTRGTKAGAKSHEVSSDSKFQDEKSQKKEEKRQRRARPWFDGQ